MEFDRKKCLELMAESKKLRQEGKYLHDFDRVKSQKLSQYITLLSDHVFWKSRDQYLQILEKFVSKNIDIDTFIKKFRGLRRSNMTASKILEKNLENEIDFQPNLESRGFTKIISSINDIIELFDPEVTLDMNLLHPELICYGVSEDFLKLDLIKFHLPLIKKYCEES